jgi:septum formation protein
MSRTVLLASASVARFELLSSAGIHPLVQVSNVDEDAIMAANPQLGTAEMCRLLAAAKGQAVAADVSVTQARDVLIIAADSMLEFDGAYYGKPGTPQHARERWQAMRGRHGVLHTGHWVHDMVTGQTLSGIAGATVYFAEVSDDEGRSAAFISRIDGDGPAVGGISLHLLRTLTAHMGITWHSLWNAH